MKGRHRSCHKKTETEHIKRLTTKEENDVFSLRTIGAGADQNEVPGAETLSY